MGRDEEFFFIPAHKAGALYCKGYLKRRKEEYMKKFVISVATFSLMVLVAVIMAVPQAQAVDFSNTAYEPIVATQHETGPPAFVAVFEIHNKNGGTQTLFKHWAQMTTIAFAT